MILNMNRSHTETETTYLGKLISDIFLAVDREHDPRIGIWNDLMGPIILLV